MYLTHPDQIARMRDNETNEPMFEDVGHALWVAYSLEHVPAHVKTPMWVLLKRAREEYKDEELKKRVNFSGLNNLEIRAQLIFIRNTAEKMLDEQCIKWAWARCAIEGQKKRDGMKEMSRIASGTLTRRGRDMCDMIVWWIFAPPHLKNRENPRNIARKCNVSLSTVEKDTHLMISVYAGIKDRVNEKLQGVFMREGIIT